jgi:hypothetical protein
MTAYLSVIFRNSRPKDQLLITTIPFLIDGSDVIQIICLIQSKKSSVKFTEPFKLTYDTKNYYNL